MGGLSSGEHGRFIGTTTTATKYSPTQFQSRCGIGPRISRYLLRHGSFDFVRLCLSPAPPFRASIPHLLILHPRPHQLNSTQLNSSSPCLAVKETVLAVVVVPGVVPGVVHPHTIRLLLLLSRSKRAVP